MKVISKIKLKELYGEELQHPEMKFLVGGCGSKEYKICCNPGNNKCSGGEKTSPVCSGDLCNGQNYNCS